MINDKNSEAPGWGERTKNGGCLRMPDTKVINIEKSYKEIEEIIFE